MRLKIILMLVAVAIPLHSATALTAVAIENAQGPMGLRTTNAAMTTSETSVTVDASIFRSRLTRVLTPVQLQINLVNADGTIASSEIRVVSAADLVRLNSSDKHVKVAFNNLLRAENYAVSVEWL